MLKNVALKGFFFMLFQQVGSQIIGFVLLVVLSRLLEPRDFGLIGMVALLFTIGNVLIDSGLGKSLLRNPDSDDYHFSVIFTFNAFIGFFLYSVLFLIAPFVAHFYDESQLTMIVRVLGISLIIGALSSIQQTHLIKTFQFAKLSYLSLISSAAGAVVGIWMAYNGFGIWSIIFTTLSGQIVLLILLWSFSGWNPKKLIVDHNIFTLHFGFGSRLMLTNLIDAISRNIYNIILGKKYSPEIVSYYYRSENFRHIIVMSLITATNKVSYPLLASIQDNKSLFAENYKKVISILSFVVTPVLIYSCFFAKEIIVFLLTEKWQAMTVYLQLISLSGLLYPLTSFNTNALSVTGKSHMVLKLELINKSVLVILALATSFFDIKILLLSYVLYGVVEYLVTIYCTQEYINYKALHQVLDFLPCLWTSIISGAIPFLFLKIYNLGLFYNLITSFIIFLSVYVLLNYIFRNKGLFYILNLVRKK